VDAAGRTAIDVMARRESVQFFPLPGITGPKQMSVEPSSFAIGLPIWLSDVKGWPLSRPAPVSGLYTVIDQKSFAGMYAARFSL